MVAKEVSRERMYKMRNTCVLGKCVTTRRDFTRRFLQDGVYKSME